MSTRGCPVCPTYIYIYYKSNSQKSAIKHRHLFAQLPPLACFWQVEMAQRFEICRAHQTYAATKPFAHGTPGNHRHHHHHGNETRTMRVSLLPLRLWPLGQTLERSSWLRIGVFGLSGWTGIVSSCDRSKGITTLWSWVWYSCVGTEAPGSQTWEDALLCDTAAGDSILLAPGFPPKPRDSRVFSTTSSPAATTVARVSKRRFLFISCSPSPLVWPFGRGTGDLLRSRSMCRDLPTFSWVSSCLCPPAFFFFPSKTKQILKDNLSVQKLQQNSSTKQPMLLLLCNYLQSMSKCVVKYIMFFLSFYDALPI